MEKTRFEKMMNEVVWREMQRPGDDLPDMGALMRAFEQDALTFQKRKFTPRKIASLAVRVFSALLCAALFYLLTVLVDAPIVRRPSGLPEPHYDTELSMPKLSDARVEGNALVMHFATPGDASGTFTLPFPEMNVQGWSLSDVLVADERSDAGSFVRSVRLIYQDADDRAVTVAAYVPGGAVGSWLEAGGQLVERDVRMCGLVAALLHLPGGYRAYTMVGSTAISVTGTHDIAEQEIVDLLEHVTMR